MEEFGQFINHMFESQMQWYFDNGVVYFTGRDIVAFALGFITCILLILTRTSIKYGIEERKEIRRNKNNGQQQIHRIEEVSRENDQSGGCGET